MPPVRTELRNALPAVFRSSRHGEYEVTAIASKNPSGAYRVTVLVKAERPWQSGGRTLRPIAKLKRDGISGVELASVKTQLRKRVHAVIDKANGDADIRAALKPVGPR